MGGTVSVASKLDIAVQEALEEYVSKEIQEYKTLAHKYRTIGVFHNDKELIAQGDEYMNKCSELIGRLLYFRMNPFRSSPLWIEVDDLRCYE